MLLVNEVESAIAEAGSARAAGYSGVVVGVLRAFSGRGADWMADVW